MNPNQGFINAGALIEQLESAGYQIFSLQYRDYRCKNNVFHARINKPMKTRFSSLGDQRNKHGSGFFYLPSPQFFHHNPF